MKIETWLKALIGLVGLVMVLVVTIPYVQNVDVRAMLAQQTFVSQKERDLLALRNLMRDAEVGHLGYVVSVDESFLRSYYSAVDAFPGVRKSLRAQMREAGEKQTFHEIEQVLDIRLLSIEQTVLVRRAQGFEAARSMVSTAVAGKYSSQINKLRALITQQID